MEQVGRYEIENELAEGGMGVVYAARDPLMKRRVALKLLKPDYSANETLRGRFLSEAEAVARLEHPAIVPVYDFGEHEGQLYFVMRYLPGGTLLDRIEEAEGMSARDLAPVLTRVGQALDAAHAAGLIHRDIKPANILFDDKGAAYLSDFGIAKGVRSEGDDTGTLVIGTPRYMSPEQAQALATVDARSDIYSLGAVAYHALAGRPPFLGGSAIALALKHVTEDAPSILEFAPSLPKVVDKLFRRVMAKDADYRYSSAGAFAKDIADVAAGRWYLIKMSDIPEPPRAEPTADASTEAQIVARTMDLGPRPVDPSDEDDETTPDPPPDPDATANDSQLDDTGVFDPADMLRNKPGVGDREKN